MSFTRGKSSELDAIYDNTITRASAKRKIRKSRHTPEAWRKIWMDTLKARYPHAGIMYTGRVANNLQQAVSRGFPVEDIGKFIEWVIKDWDRHRRYVFSFNPKKEFGPEIPSMELVVRHLDALHAKFQTETKREHLFSQPKPGRAAFEGLPDSRVAPVNAPRPPPVRTGFIREPVKLPDYDPVKARETRKRLGLKEWDEGK